MSDSFELIKKKSLALHKKSHGKFAIASKVPVRDMEDLKLIYTPGVGAVSSYIAAHKQETRDFTMKGNSVAVISDGSAVLGLGNIGPEGALPVMEGKCLIFKKFADIDAVPIVLATQNTEEIIRVVKAIAPGFGGINLEDIAAPRCFEIEKRLRRELDIPVMHDDQHGTAIIILAGLVNALKVVGKKMADIRIVLNGAGAAGTGITKILASEKPKDIIVCDSRGIIDRKRSDLNSAKKELTRLTNKRNLSGDLALAMNGADVFIGVSGPKLVTQAVVRSMAKNAIVFALANPIPEIMPPEASAGGARVVATGRSDFPNQLNNSQVFPGVFRGALDHRVREITEEMKRRAAYAIAALVSRPTAKKLVPGMFDKRLVPAIARIIR
ncbi:MAG: malate dehydrogenase [Candidatus Sungbacteria bacterium RIFCSPLOWO2_02_FULL_48_13b]|uniref:Malate dehydrogenase n=2 Tax=Candidatus Sungiibacteriota TaxID=1817917 RepID=A0A1G2LL64_9BACT|nr:MAG: malate dehydrogenase [Candidatus Sungbacteria bacterium RIFCSPHIGHO2_02_FULL_49_20]OHA11599.1 MAG: malate dehydrogenase [Candidatus Sungbacteria bacterium RIFCSPLOWO2_02_FULL_48_13b]